MGAGRAAMTPTLPGRWQTRVLLLGAVGLVLSLIFGAIVGDLRTPLALLGYVLLLGCYWDAFYHYLQSWRWDRDWPPAFQVAAGLVEGMTIWLLITASRSMIGYLPGVAATLTFQRFVTHYGIVWLAMFLTAQGPLRVLLPHWRHRGGEWW
jgi:hypothetical protein